MADEATTTEAPAIAAAEVEAPASPIPAGSPLGTQAPAETPAGEDKPAGEEKPEGEAEDLSSHEFKVPEGLEVPEAEMTGFKSILQESGIKADAGQKLLDFAAGAMKTQAEGFAKAQTDAWGKTIETWKSELQANPDFAGDNGPKAQLAIARALDEYGTPETRQAFDLTGAGWNPAITAFVYKMAMALNEGGPPVAPKGPADAPAPARLRDNYKPEGDN